LYLPINSLTCSWEKKLTKDDVDLLIEFRKRKYPDVEREIRQLDSFASRLMICGLIAYGWKQDELFHCKNNIVKVLKKHVPNFNKIPESQLQLLHRDSNASDQNDTAMEESTVPSTEDTETLDSAANISNQPQDGLRLLAEAAFHNCPRVSDKRKRQCDVAGLIDHCQRRRRISPTDQDYPACQGESDCYSVFNFTVYAEILTKVQSRSINITSHSCYSF
jgi:hypothetical protein